ncbi:hypothetical protein ACFVUW_30060 [Streptomyces xiamenensis]|uniref:hypothetical protein n=1 Tax=Streptomyces xiamenensis TaxID=408015 RepID=UPI0036EEBC2D
MIGLLRRLAARLTRRPAAVDTPTIRLRVPPTATAADHPRPLPTLPEFPDEEAMRARLRDVASPGGHTWRTEA